MRTIGANIRYYRKLHHLTQEKLAELTDISEKLISFYETDKRFPPIFNLLEIAQGLGVSVEELCGVKTEDDGTELETRITWAVKNILREYKVERNTGIGSTGGTEEK